MNTAYMNIAYNIDTLQFSRRMQKAGLKQEVADELAEALKEAGDKSIENLVTKDDLKIFKSEIKSEIGTLKSEIGTLKSEIGIIRSEIKTLEHFIELAKKDVTIKLGSLMSLGVAILAALIKL